jgi:FHS family Na+ dependent glucose MFS transporter 1
MATAVLGPSLLDLIAQTGSSIKDLSMIFPARAGSYMVGSWLAGFLFDRLKGHRLLSITMVVMGVSLGLVPFLSEANTLILLIMGMALAMGLADVGCNSLLFRVRDINLGPIMNGLHLFYGMGSFFAPLILIGSLSTDQGIRWGFWGLGIFSVLILIQLINLPEPEQLKSVESGNELNNPGLGIDQRLLILYIAIFFFAFVGVEIGFGDWLSTYSIQMGLANKRTAILLTSTYWGSFTAGRIISIPLALKINSKYILVMDIAGSVIALALMLIFPGSAPMLWVGTILLGLSVASIFATMLTFTESFMQMTGKITSRFFISGSIGSIVLPWIIGRFIDRTGPYLIIQLLSITMLLAVLSFLMVSNQSKRSR